MPRWPLWKLFLFRWAALYGLLYFGSKNLPWWIPWSKVAAWAAALWGVTLPPQTVRNGSGDTLESYVLCAVWLALALGLAVVWSLPERRGTLTQRLAWPLHTLLRYALAFSLLYYGWSKVFLAQMPMPDLTQLVRPLGEKSPMGLLWTTVGLSPLYQMVGGCAEVIPGVLLLFRRTSLVGAALGAGVMAYVFLLNLSFDVPVKLFSGHLMVFSLLALVPFLPRLWAFVRGGSVPAMLYPAPPEKPVWRWLGWAARAGALAYLLLLPLLTVRQVAQLYSSQPNHSRIAGIYAVRNDSLVPHPQVGLDMRWHTLVLSDFQYRGGPDTVPVNPAQLELVSGNRSQGTFQENPATSTLTLLLGGNSETYHYRRSESGELKLSSDSRQITLTPKPHADRLKTRGFRWVSDRPFNR